MTLADSFPYPIAVSRAVGLAAAADVVWEMIGNLGDTRLFRDLVEELCVDGVGVGAIRTFVLPGGARIVERIEHYDHIDHCYVYRILDFGPLPLARYLGLAQVSAAGPGRAMLFWSAMIQPLDGDEGQAGAMIEASIGQTLAAAQRWFGAAAAF